MLNIHPDMDSSEKEVIEVILKDAKMAGYIISVHDGIETVLSKSADMERVFSKMFSTGSDRLTFFEGARRIGSVWLVYGNGRDVMSDWSDNQDTEELLMSALELASE